MRHLTLFTIMLIAPAAVAADDLYESLDNVRLGRLFLSPAERQTLEARRGDAAYYEGVNNDGSESGPAAVVESPRRPAAGYIVAGTGRPLVWVDGAFRRADASTVARLKFPGVVQIEKSHTAELATGTDPRPERDGAAHQRAPDKEPAADRQRQNE